MSAMCLEGFLGTQSPDEVIVTGSHIDTVINGGKYDGAYGVLAAMLAIKRLKETYGAPKKNARGGLLM